MLKLGVNDFHIKDERLSPLIYRGLLFSASVSYNYQRNKYLHEIEFSVSPGKLFCTFNQNQIEEYNGYVSYSLLYQIYKKELSNSNFDFNVGTGIESYMSWTHTRNPNVFLSSGEYSWYWSHSVPIILDGRYNINYKHCINLQISSPLIRLVSRPDYSQNQRYYEIQYNPQKAALYGDIEFLWSDFVFFTKLSYDFKLSNHFDFNLSYRFNFASTHKTELMRLYTNNLLIGTGWKF